MNIVEEVRAKRQKLADVLMDEEYSGIRKIVEELYPDNAHFIYELLQNAEDTAAKEANFTLSHDKLVFEHNGKPFDKGDIEGITNIGMGSKADDSDKIGRFGVGFKAVFAYSETPHIWSPTASFKIENLVLPYSLSSKREIGDKTHFEFPFNNPKKPPEDAYAEIETGLDELAETTLLFLGHLEAIRWQIGGRTGEVLRIQHSENHFEVLKQIDGKTTTSAHFLKFSQAVDDLEKQYVSIAYALEYLPNIRSFDTNKQLAKQLKITSANPGQVAVFFPAEKETSGLRFHLHAPFVPELSRASIKDTPANEPLFAQLAKLAASALHKIRELGLLNADFLGVLPNGQDALPFRYEGIRSAIVEAMNSKPLTPTYSKSHAPAQQLFQAKASFKELLSIGDLAYLADYKDEPPQWAIGANQKNNQVDRFLNQLAITEWGIEEFVELLEEKISENERSEADAQFLKWLGQKAVSWHQQLYALLYKELEDELHLPNTKIVRLANGEYSVGSKCFFPDESSMNDDTLPRIDAAIYTFGNNKTQKENAKKFLKEIGVREVGEAEQIEAILQRRYTKGSDFPDDKTHWKDLKRFIALVEEQPNKSSLFQKHLIFKIYDKKYSWGTPSIVFLDSPFLETGLGAYYKAIGEDTGRYPLAPSYKNSKFLLEKLTKFAKKIGAQTLLEISEVNCRQNPKWDYLWRVPGERRTSPIDKDYKINGIESIFENPDINVSRLVWRTMCALGQYSSELTATYQENYTNGSRTAPSQLVHQLKNVKWIPQNTGDSICFVQPANASSDRLPKGFPYEPGAHWLGKICFGQKFDVEQAKKEQEELQLTEEAKRTEDACKELGFAGREEIEELKELKELFSPEEIEQRKYELEHQPELPEKTPSNPELRAQRVGELAASAPERQTEKRTRSVSVARDDVKKEAKQYLRQLYTNPDDEMICQICKGPLPFKLDDGTGYFETTEFLKELGKHHYQNYLALCPNHGAMFKLTNGAAELMKDMLVELDGNELDVVLAQKDDSVYFTKTHITDLRAIIKMETTKSHIINDQSNSDKDKIQTDRFLDTKGSNYLK
ncbi:sacsin N-terminal ATP-binding-like domain-containing protein [Paremcibacter congregatus]|uniref:sacsin N-terminal ATP-binding-like domain-containing protein n=1 Tax=Paremcibacter congregatus TaxID=2043170 RepID=UPI0030EB48F4|tara:strand:- start:2536 stop:5736 length:3201 start_codon:yes stop_codon:yes gene_type:complete